ncbi:family S53 protease-like protein [Roridomyces roridus]|uniref:tripeptidyl-peptidase II n=1 Tax=Roridomyces roridus TaxID=1738132 RepID=A0AAD7FT89_9AGAR|nr:family S53 protease-like protein [Roridomyces roridus]
MLLTCVVLVLVLSCAKASLAGNVDTDTMVVLERVSTTPPEFAHLGAGTGGISPDEELTLRIALSHSNIEGLQERTYAVSDPTHSLYGEHLSTKEIAEFVNPPAETLSVVTTWLTSRGITPVPLSSSPFNDVLQITVPARQANVLLGADFQAFVHEASGTRMVRTLSYAIPAEMVSHIRYVHPTTAFVPPPARAATSVTIPASCAFDTNPGCLQDVFGIPSDKANHSSSNILGVAGYVEQYANEADLTRFLTNTRPDLNGSTFSVITLDGGTNDQSILLAGDEANLDIQYTVGVASGVPVTFISVGNNTQDGIAGFIDIVNTILAMPVGKRPTVLSTSYGFNEQDLPVSLAVAMCNAYMQLGAAGISAMFASGDGGVGGVQPTTCTQFVPSAPGGCPFVTSVGGTTNVPPHAASLFSSGGFSNYFPTPSYQATDVTKYVDSIGSLYQGLYNTSGRGFPDVSAASHNIEIVLEGDVTFVDGTSCATPIFASIIALVNDRLIAAGKPVLGFLNPFLYSAQGRAAFTDVISGNNPGCNTNGFSATSGWDPVTGLGTPNFDALMKAVGL